MLSLVESLQPDEALLGFLVAAAAARALARVAERKSVRQLAHAARRLLTSRVAVALALTCVDLLFGVGMLLCVLFVGGLPSGEEVAPAAVRLERGCSPEAAVAELRRALAAKEPAQRTGVVNALLEDLTAHFELDLLDAILAHIPSLGVAPDSRSFEVLLEANRALGNFHEVRSLAARLRAMGRLTPRMARTQLDAALETGSRDEALDALRSEPVLRPSDSERLLALGVDPEQH